jgi:hypothetical protein
MDFKDYLENRYHFVLNQLPKEEIIPWKKELEYYLDDLEGRSLKEKKINFNEFSSFMRNISRIKL